MARKMSHTLLCLKMCSQSIKNIRHTLQIANRIGDKQGRNEAVADLLDVTDEVIRLLMEGWKHNPPSLQDELESLKAAFTSHQDLAYIVLNDRPGMTDKQHRQSLTNYRKMTKTLRARALRVYKMLLKEWPHLVTTDVVAKLKRYANLR
jgi:hypothetical protein